MKANLLKSPYFLFELNNKIVYFIKEFRNKKNWNYGIKNLALKILTHKEAYQASLF